MHSQLNSLSTCNCNQSRCLKMYCVCFSGGMLCREGCTCLGCKNRGDNQDRSEAINSIIIKDSHAFSKKPMPNGCHCLKSGCLKKYCDCFKMGLLCTEDCECRGCCNRSSVAEDPKCKKKIKTD